MGLNYDKLKENGHGEGTAEALATYTDLFMSLSLIFLLMYVVASLKQGAGAISGNIERAKLERENEDLKSQLKAYNALKDSSLQDQTEEEQKNYEQLMNKLSLLQEEAKTEKNNLRKQAMENERKEEALNQYQQMVRNMINSQMLSKKQLKSREQVIDRKNETIENQREDLTQKENQIQNLNQDIEQKRNELANNEQKIQNMNQELQNKINDLKKAEKNNSITKTQMKKQIENLRSQAAGKISQLQSQNQQTQSELENLKQNLSQSENAIQGLKSEVENTKTAMSNLEKSANETKQQMGRQIASISNELKSAQEELNARKKIAKSIQDNLNKSGVNASVNDKTGDVIISFGDDYFPAGSAKVNQSMESILNKFMPKYTESLFKDKNIAEKIDSVEIIGFASPTYGGKYIDPNSLDPKDKKAVKYNLDLSYQRARAIFEHAFDTDRIKFEGQKKLLPLVKVSGRSFFADGEKTKGVKSGMSEKEFCRQFDCEKSQKVIVKFNLDTQK